MEWQKEEIIVGTKGVQLRTYSKWKHGRYSIIKMSNETFMAYVDDNRYPTDPPDLAPCEGCRDSNCNGMHPCWLTFKSAEASCIDHATNLPW